MQKKRNSKRDNHSHRALNKIGNELDFATSEAYNFLRTNISFSIPNKNGCKLIGVTSSTPMEGKSYTCVNLAYSLAESGQKVLLIDGDLRKPAIGRMLNKKYVKGLSNFLAENEHSIINTGLLSDNLAVIFSGDTPPNPSELIGSKKMHTALEKLSKHFNYILIDLPPVNVVSDPLIISKWLDGIIVVVKHKYTRTSDIVNSVKSLKYVNANIIGFVYNGCTNTEKTYGRRGSYYYTSSYSSHKSEKSEDASSIKEFEEADVSIDEKRS